MVGQALTGKRQSIPKITTVKADDSKKIVFKSMGNNHVNPFMWADTISMTATDAVVIASGVSFQGRDLATYGNVVATPKTAINQHFYIEYNTVDNIVTLKTASAVTGDFNVQIMIGENSPSRYIESYVK